MGWGGAPLGINRSSSCSSSSSNARSICQRLQGPESSICNGRHGAGNAASAQSRLLPSRLLHVPAARMALRRFTTSSKVGRWAGSRSQQSCTKVRQEIRNRCDCNFQIQNLKPSVGPWAGSRSQQSCKRLGQQGRATLISIQLPTPKNGQRLNVSAFSATR